MKEKRKTFASFLEVSALAILLLLSSCVTLKMVSQRPSADSSAVDATSGATTVDDTSQPGGDAYSKPAAPATDVDATATS